MVHLLIFLERLYLIFAGNTLEFQHGLLFPADIFLLQTIIGKTT
jgi:hypothetical protein